MANFQVTASSLKQKGEELQALNNNFAKKVEELQSAEKTLGGMWEGTAKTTFENAFNTDISKISAFKAAVDDCYAKLIQIASEYAAAESRNVQRAGN